MEQKIGKNLQEVVESYRGYTVQLEIHNTLSGHVGTTYVGDNVDLLVERANEGTKLVALIFYVTLWVDGNKSEILVVNKDLIVKQVHVCKEEKEIK